MNAAGSMGGIPFGLHTPIQGVAVAGGRWGLDLGVRPEHRFGTGEMGCFAIAGAYTNFVRPGKAIGSGSTLEFQSVISGTRTCCEV